MALDSQEKRMSAATAGRIWMRAVFPSGTIDEEERLSAGLAYGGNALSPASVTVRRGMLHAPRKPRSIARDRRGGQLFQTSEWLGDGLKLNTDNRLDFDLDNVFPIVDTTNIVKDPADATKMMRIDVGAVATSTIVILTMPNSDVDLQYAADVLMTTKGDILVDNGTNPVRLAVGTNNQVLTADSAQASGVKWAAGGGDVTGPGSSTDNAIATFDGTGGKTLQESGVIALNTDLTASLLQFTSSVLQAIEIRASSASLADEQVILQLSGLWDGTQVSRIDLAAGPDTTNKDDGKILFKTATGGAAAANRLKIHEDGACVFTTDAYQNLIERTTTPADPAVSAACNIYMKADKLIIQYDDAGTTRYKYLDLTGIGVTWTHTTTAP